MDFAVAEPVPFSHRNGGFGRRFGFELEEDRRLLTPAIIVLNLEAHGNRQ